MAPTPAQPSVVALPSPAPAPRSVNLELTFKADSACTELPAAARSRTYSAAVNTRTPLFNLAGGNFGGSSDPYYSWNTIYQKLLNDEVDWSFQDPELWEFLTDDSYVVVYGGPAHVPVDAATMEPKTGDFPFWGRFTYCAEQEPDSYPECEVPAIACESFHHTLTVVKR